MRICIYGAGAIGGTLGLRLAQAGHEVSLVARGAHVAAIRANGLTLEKGERRDNVKLPASDNPADLGAQDAVIIALKGHSLPAAAAGLAPLLGADTAVVSVMNGIPWWFFDGWGGKLAGTRLEACDPGGRIAAAVAPARVVGGVTFLAADVPEPGVVRHNSGTRVVLGEPSHQPSARVAALAAALTAAGFEAEASGNIRRDIWLKLLGNVCFNPVSVLTGVSTDRMLDDRHMAGLFAGMMHEAIALARALGLDITVEPEARMAQTRKLGAIKTSMLQDVEAGRPIELDGIVGSVVEIAEHLGVPVPNIGAMFGAVRLRAAMLGLYHPVAA
jgi:2-dehydropantoate 2-reductase